MRYHDTYWYTQIVFRTLTDDQFAFGRTLHEFFGEHNYPRLIGSFPRWSLLHDYILFTLLQVEYEQMPRSIDDDFLRWHEENWGPPAFATPIEAQCAQRNIAVTPFPDWLKGEGIALGDADEDSFHEYHEALGDFGVFEGKRYVAGPRGALYERLTDEVFFLAFMNRHLLLALHVHASEHIEELRIDEVDEEFVDRLRRDGVLKRTHIPAWARQAVFFRDRGRCVFCNSDLSNLTSLQNDDNFDHIVPLASGGANDVTNLQLLCSACNKEKSATPGRTSGSVERWY